MRCISPLEVKAGIYTWTLCTKIDTLTFVQHLLAFRLQEHVGSLPSLQLISLLTFFKVVKFCLLNFAEWAAYRMQYSFLRSSYAFHLLCLKFSADDDTFINVADVAEESMPSIYLNNLNQKSSIMKEKR